MELSLTDRIAMVTGATTDIGRAVAVGLAEQGAHLALCDVAGSPLASVARQILDLGRQAHTFEVDFDDVESIRNAVASTAAQWNRLDVLVNNLMAEEKAPFLDVPAGSWDRQLSFNARAPFLCAQAAAQVMVRHGRGAIVNRFSVAGQVYWPNTSAYNASRGALESLTGTLALELAPLGVRVNGVATAHIENVLNRKQLADPVVRAETARQIPLGYVARPEDVVGAILFLVSEVSAYVVGHTLIVDGGYVLR